MTRTVSILLDRAGLARALQVPTFRLRVVKGTDRKKEKRSSGGIRLLIGSGSGADLQLHDETVSAVHCEVVASPEGFRVRDLGSKNGVWLDGRRIDAAWIRHDDDLEVGESVVRFSLLGDVEEQPLPQRSSFGRLAGSSVRMRQLYDELERAASGDSTVLILGETGTGKELAAEAIYQAGVRKNRPLVVLDCARLPLTLAESELFGHEKGAFTGAQTRVVGAFERAQGGTLFLDEVGELPLALQSKLLGVLERRQITRLGGDRPIDIDVRVVAATHRDLGREVNRGTFRSDLYFRLAVLVVHMPALREHPEDIPELVAGFLEELPDAPRLGPGELKRLCEGDYPGNVRELRNAVERAVLGLSLDRPGVPQLGFSMEEPFRVQKERLLAAFERAYIDRLLDACGGNVSEAARRSGLSRVHLHALIRRFGLGRAQGE